MFHNTRIHYIYTIYMPHTLSPVFNKIFVLYTSVFVCSFCFRSCVINTKEIKVYELENHNILDGFYFLSLTLSVCVFALQFAAVCSFARVHKTKSDFSVCMYEILWKMCHFFTHQMQNNFASLWSIDHFHIHLFVNIFIFTFHFFCIQTLFPIFAIILPKYMTIGKKFQFNWMTKKKSEWPLKNENKVEQKLAFSSYWIRWNGLNYCHCTICHHTLIRVLDFTAINTGAIRNESYSECIELHCTALYTHCICFHLITNAIQFHS